MKTEQVTKRSRAHITYKLADGTAVPGVTTVLSVLNKPALVKWANNLGCFTDAMSRVEAQIPTNTQRFK